MFLVLHIIFLPFCFCLLAYHTFLLASGLTTWEHARKRQITYMRVYPTGILPFYTSVVENLKRAFCHGNECQEWELREPHELKEEQGFNICDNHLYSCC